MHADYYERLFKKLECMSGESLKENIVFMLVNTEKERLSNVPHRIFKDLAVVYRLVSKSGSMGEVLDNRFLKACSMDEEELYELACANVRRRMSPHVQTLSQVELQEERSVRMRQGMPEELAYILYPEKDDETK